MIQIQKSNQKVAVVSGAFGYLGREISQELAQAGWKVAMLYRKDNQKENEEDIVSALGVLGQGGHRAYSCNLSNGTSVQEVFTQIENEMGMVDVCVHAAGKKGERKKLLQTTEEELREQLDANVVTGFHFLTQSARLLKEHKAGTLIGVTTIGIVNENEVASLGAYIPAKFALQGMLTILRGECASVGVDVYSVAPGFMEGGMNRDIPQAFIELMKNKTKSGKLLTANKVARAIVTLCTKEYTSAALTVPVVEE